MNVQLYEGNVGRLDTRKLVRCFIAFVCFTVTMTVFALVRPSIVFADTPSMIDFGQSTGSSISVHRVDTSKNALFVTKSSSGDCQIEAHPVKDDSITGFVGEHPAWELNVPLTWYFMEPVYERNLSITEQNQGKISV